jgi:hypothetical protein
LGRARELPAVDCRRGSDRVASPTGATPEENHGTYFGVETFAQLSVLVGLSPGLFLGAYGAAAMFLGVGSFTVASVVFYLIAGRRILCLAARVPNRPFPKVEC